MAKRSTGTIEYYDHSFIRLTRKDGPNLFIYKHDIKYLVEGGLSGTGLLPQRLACPSRLFPQTMTSPLETAVEIAREAGALLVTYYERRVPFELKGEFDLVTEADRASEKLVVERLQSRFPQHGIVAEEGGGHTSPSEYRWYVDPLDGTTNFAHSLPIFNVTLALERAGEMLAGVVFDPIRQEMFTAERGSGAHG